MNHETDRRRKAEWWNGNLATEPESLYGRCVTHKLQIKDFSVQTQTEFQQAISERQADLPSIAEKMVEHFGYVLRPKDVSLSSDRGFYDYRLSFKMFNGAADMVLTSTNVVTNFRDGQTNQALAIVGKSIETIYRIAVTRQIQVNQLNYAVHAEFDSAEAYQAHMAPFVSAKTGYLSGGKIIQAETGKFKGEFRLSIEKSIRFENAIYALAQFVTEEPFSDDLFRKMAERFNEITSVEGLNIELPDENPRIPQPQSKS